jgi:serine/threonine protein kinase
LKEINVSKLKKEMFSNQTAFDFESEVNNLKEVHHFSFVQHFGHFDYFISEENHKFSIVREFVDGDNLQILINARTNKKRPFSEDFIQTCLFNICSALKYFKDSKIIYCYLKSSNIILSIPGDIKLTDFGFSKILSSYSHGVFSFKGTFSHL